MGFIRLIFASVFTEIYVRKLSNKDYFKIKNEAASAEEIAEVNEMISKWAAKYKITLEKVPNKNTYYVIGYK